jgi:hypothetical protein
VTGDKVLRGLQLKGQIISNVSAVKESDNYDNAGGNEPKPNKFLSRDDHRDGKATWNWTTVSIFGGLDGRAKARRALGAQEWNAKALAFE